MEILFEVSKEHPSIPTSEAISCLKAEGISYQKKFSDNDVFIVSADKYNEKIKRIVSRLSYTFFVDELLFSCSTSLNDIKKCSQEISFNKTGSIAIFHKNRSSVVNSKPILKIIGDIFTKDRIVNLNNPDYYIRVLITDKKIYVGSMIGEVNRSEFEKRKVQNRPFFSPISLHPKLARALVNFSQIKKNEVLLDPFCGTGGILIEAGLIGAKVIGCDIEKKMIDGCKKTLEYYNISNQILINSDIGDLHNFITKFDAVVTDLPYGKSTTTKGENIDNLYNRAFEKIAQLLKKNSMAVIVSPNENLYIIGRKYFTINEKHEVRVHRSLTRHIAVFQN